jgi:predicted lipoprotein with Yx(FWY)xxD motif
MNEPPDIIVHDRRGRNRGLYLGLGIGAALVLLIISLFLLVGPGRNGGQTNVNVAGQGQPPSQVHLNLNLTVQPQATAAVATSRPLSAAQPTSPAATPAPTAIAPVAATSVPATSQPTPLPSLSPTPIPLVSTLNAGAAGSIVVDQSRMTLYTLSADRPGVSTCSGGCATAWPPAVIDQTAVATIHQGGDAGMSQLGTFTRADGGIQLTWAGMPLYRFTRDTVPGDVNGNGVTAFGGTWAVVKAPSS